MGPWKPIVDCFTNVFKDDAGHIKGHKAKLYKKEGVQPRFFRPWSVPYSHKEKVDKELTCLETAGIIEKITSSDWAAPIIHVVNRDGSIKICGDYRLTANVATIMEFCPFLKIEDIFVTLMGGKNS